VGHPLPLLLLLLLLYRHMLIAPVLHPVLLLFLAKTASHEAQLLWLQVPVPGRSANLRRGGVFPGGDSTTGVTRWYQKCILVGLPMVLKTSRSCRLHAKKLCASWSS